MMWGLVIVGNVIGLVVQPGVEFDHTGIIDYQQEEAQALKPSGK